MTLPLAQQSPEPLGDPAEVWDAVRDQVRPSISDGSYRMWFADVEAQGVDGTVLQLTAPSDYVRNWLVSHYMDVLTQGARTVLGADAAVRIHVAPSEAPAPTSRPGGERRRGRIERIERQVVALRRQDPVVPVVHAVQVDSRLEEVGVARQAERRHVTPVAAAP